MTEIQTISYARFLQLECLPEQREAAGLEGVLKEIFPIKSYDGQISLEYIKYELGKPRYGPDECRQLRLTYGRPFRVWLRLNKQPEPVAEEVYLGDMPIMIGGGEFIINGAERVVVSQLHRSPGVDFVVETDGDRKQHSCRIIPERGSWIEINVTKKETLGVRIDQSGKFSAMTLLRAMDPAYTDDAAILRAFYPDRDRRPSTRTHRAKLKGSRAVGDVIDPETGEVYLESGQAFTDEKLDVILASQVTEVAVLGKIKDDIILKSLEEDPTSTHEEALLKIYQRLRPGNPPQLEKAKQLFEEKFQDANRYRLGKVGRFRINRKFDQDIPESEMTLRALDYLNAIRYVFKLRDPSGQGHIDDIDHLGNRRVRTIDELAADELRKGFLKLRRTVQERMSIRDQQDMTPRSLINPKSISAAIEYFFGRGELSQVVDQTNPAVAVDPRAAAVGAWARAV